MLGTELFGAEERKEIEDVLSTGIMFRFNHDAQRNNIWKAKDFEEETKKNNPCKIRFSRIKWLSGYNGCIGSRRHWHRR